ncbi:MAG: DUF3592 domain-containing protein [Kordiimonadaceae bacterium]|nr:DUF3592 domain-containing protein [Kordiimonadaceae bacterium]
MFDIIFDLFSAWNQITVLVMGTAFMGIGGAFIVYELYWRFKSIKVKGRISEVRVSGYKPKQKKSDTKIDTVENFKKDKRVKPFGALIICLFIGFPLLFSGIGFYMGYSYLILANEGNYAKAIVIRNDSSYDSESGTSYKAVLKFTDQTGKEWQVKDNISYGNSPSFDSGTEVGVYYDENDPNDFVIDDFWHNMAIALIFATFGFVFIGIIFLASYFNKRKKKLPPSNVPNYNGEMYHSVFEYRTPDGQYFEQISSMSSNSIIGRMPGTFIDLMILPHNPEKVRRPTVFWLIFGMVFFIPGSFIMNMAIKSFNLNYMMTFLFVIGAYYLGHKVFDLYERITRTEFDRSLLSEMWQNFKNNRMQKTNIEEIKGRVLKTSEVIDRIKFQLKYYHITGYIMLVIMFGTTIGAYYAGQNMIDLNQNGQTTVGQISNIISRTSTDNNGYTYYAEASFIDQSGKQHRFLDDFGANYPLFKIGETVDILYSTDNPDDAIIDRGIFNWLIRAGLIIAALFALWGAQHFLTAKTRFGRN